MEQDNQLPSLCDYFSQAIANPSKRAFLKRTPNTCFPLETRLKIYDLDYALSRPNTVWQTMTLLSL